MNRPNRRGIAATLLLTAAILFSCTKVDNQFGDDFIPDDEQMKVCLDTLRGIDTYLTESDSFPTSGMVYGYMGSGWDPVFGRTKASFCAQYNMNYFTTGSEMFGIAPVFDSLMLWLTFNGSFYGDSSKTQKFNIYELTGYLDSDTTYYAYFDPSSIVSDKVLFSFEITGVPSEEVMLKLDSEAAIEFAHRLMDTTGGTYTSDSLFHDAYKGFCFAPDPSSDPDACVYRLALASMEMGLYTRNFTDATATTPKDTVITYYSFDNTLFNQAHVSMISHDYTGTPIQGINDTLTTSTPLPYGYVQTLGGVATFVRFTDDFVDQLLGKVVAPYNSMVINKASLVWSLADPTAENFNQAPSRIGSYSDYRKFTGIPDYDYTYETSSGTSLIYGGYLDRTNGNYATDITIFLQKLIAKPDSAPRTMTLGPGGDLLAEFKQVKLKTGASDPPLRVIVAYTLVK